MQDPWKPTVTPLTKYQEPEDIQYISNFGNHNDHMIDADSSFLGTFVDKLVDAEEPRHVWHLTVRCDRLLCP